MHILEGKKKKKRKKIGTGKEGEEKGGEEMCQREEKAKVRD